MGWELVQDTTTKCWINLDEIEIYETGTCKGKLNWISSVGKTVGVRYKWMNDETEERWFKIIGYNSKTRKLKTMHDNIEYEIRNDCLSNGRFGKIFNKCTNEFRYNVNDKIDKLTITDMETRRIKGENRKFYQYQCECENIDWIEEHNLKRGRRCNVCCMGSRKVLKGVNDLATTNPEMINYLVNKDDAEKYTDQSNKKVLCQCPDCGFQKQISPNHLSNRGFSCPKCSDGVSYPEKLMANILYQSNIKFISQLSKTTFEWCGNYRYDFYLPDYNIIIETHGNQHYDTRFEKLSKLSLEEQQEIDNQKEQLALNNGFKYIVIDCRKSELNWIRSEIEKSELSKLIDLTDEQWNECGIIANKSHMIIACKYKYNRENATTKEIQSYIENETGINYNISTIIEWLNKGTKLGLCYYNGKEERQKVSKLQTGKNHPNSKRVNQYTLDGTFIRTWDCGMDVQRELNIQQSNILKCCRGKRKTTGGYIWKYADETI